jgi:hypothetical protein
MLTYPDVFDRRDELTELMADLPVILLVSENKSASFSSAAYIPSVGKNSVLNLENEIDISLFPIWKCCPHAYQKVKGARHSALKISE